VILQKKKRDEKARGSEREKVRREFSSLSRAGRNTQT
jgi:hypothetical protein